MAITLTVLATRAIFRSMDDSRAEKRLAEVGGHDPQNKVLYQGWLYKRAISGTVLRTWKKRYIIIRKDRIEYHRSRFGLKPQSSDIPRGLVILDRQTTVQAAPEIKHGNSPFTIRVHRGADADDLYLNGVSQAEIDRWAGYLQATLKGEMPEKEIVVDGVALEG